MRSIYQILILSVFSFLLINAQVCHRRRTDICHRRYTSFLANSCGTVIDCIEDYITLCIKRGYNNNARLCIRRIGQKSVLVTGLSDNDTIIEGDIARYTYGRVGYECRIVDYSGYDCVYSK